MTARSVSDWPDDKSHVRSIRKPTMPRFGVWLHGLCVFGVMTPFYAESHADAWKKLASVIPKGVLSECQVIEVKENAK